MSAELAQPVSRRMTLAALAARFQEHEEEDRREREQDRRHRAEMLEEVRALRTELKPLVEVYAGARFGGRVLLGFLKFVLLVGTVMGMLYGALVWLRHPSAS